MASLILPSRRVVQPQGPVEVDWGNPITRGLLDAFSGNNLYSPTRNVFLTGVAQKVASAGGFSGDYTATVLDFSNTAPSFGGSVAENTLLVVAIPDNTALTTRSIFGYGNSASANPLCFIGLGATTGQLSYFVRSDANVAQNLQIAGGANWTQQKLAVIAGRRSEAGNFHDLYLNGSLLSTGAATTIGTTTLNRTAVGGLRRNTDGLLFDGTVPLSLSWNRALSVSELQSVSANPWQIFRPIQRRIIVDMGAGGGDVTGSLAATEIGSDTASFSAVSTVSGSLVATETGSDTATIAGQITATGSLAATEAGSDTAAFSGGSSAAIGSMAAQEVGSDTTAISGIAPATGTFTAQEAGADTASIAGASVVAGSLAATEVGSDSFFATSGAQQSVGTLAAQEVGSDTASASGAVTAQGALTATESGGDSAIMTGEARVMGLFAATETGQDVFSGTSIQLPARTGSMAATETGADGAALSGQSLVMAMFTAQEVGSDVFFASENDLTRIRPIQATYNTLAIDAGYNTTVIDPTYWID